MEFRAHNNGLFDMSPLNAKSDKSGENGSVSFSGKPSTSGMSIDSTSSQSRAPLGELQNTFEFKPVAHQQMPQPFKPQNLFAAMQNKTALDSTHLQDQAMQSPEPATPASMVSDSYSGMAGPPLTTLNSLSKLHATPDSDTVTPLMPAHTTSYAAALSASADSPDIKQRRRIVWSDILLWKAPLQSATVFLAGLGAFWLCTWVAYGAHKFTLVSGLSYLLLLDLGLNFFRYFVSKTWHDKCLWGGAAQMKHLLTRINAGFLHLASAHDSYLSAVDPFITLKVAGVLWATAWLGSFLSLWWCVLLAYVGAFTVPVAYHMTQHQLTALGKRIRAKTIERVDAAGLPRTVRFLFVCAALGVLWLTASTSHFLIGMFVALTYWRTLLAPREIDAIRTVAEPYTQSVHKVGRRISMAAGDAFDRMSTAGPKSRTKSYFGKQRRE